MRRVVGLASDELATRERVFDGLTMKAVRRSLRALSADVALLTAAATPQLSATPSEPNPTIPAGALGVVTTTWTQEVDEVLFPYLVQTFVDAAEDVYAAMPETTGVAPKITYDLAASYLRSASNRLKGVGDLVWADMRAQLVIGYEAGESINQLAGRLRKVAKISEPRALTIARTEVVPAANFGSLTQLKAVGFTDEECRKEWLATEDGRTRPAHLEADGQLVGLSQPFVVGGDFLQVPGDPAGRAENVINCRCSVAYVFDDDDDEDDDSEIDVAAGYDLLTASGSWGNYSFVVLTAAWTAADEAKIKRDAEGKFAKKAGAKITQHVPIHINTAVIYKKGGHKPNEVIAEHPGNAETEGIPARLIWHANAKKFLLQAQMDDGVSWISVESYSKKAAYDKFSKETGWTKPAKAQSVGAIPPLGKKKLTEAEGLHKAKIAESKGPQPKKFPSYMVQTAPVWEIDEWLSKLTQAEYDAFMQNEKDTLAKKVQQFNEPGLLAEHAKFLSGTKGKTPGKAESVVAVAPPKKAMFAPLKSKNINDMTTAEFVTWFNKKYPDTHDGKVNWDLAGTMVQKGVYARAQKAWDASPDGGGPFEQLHNWGYKPDKPAIVVKEMKEVAPKLGKPIHINTTAVYKTKYADGAIVAERELGDDLGTVQQLRWDAKSKKFVLLTNVGNGWKTVALYNKGETYQKFSKQTGWTHPVVKSPIPAKKATASKFATSVKVSDMTLGEVTYLVSALTSDELAAKYDQAELDELNEKLLDALDAGFVTEHEAEVLSDKITIALGQKASTINLPDLDSMNPTKALASILSMTPGDWAKLNDQQKAFVNDKFEELDASGTVSERQYKKFEKLTGQTLPAVGPAKPASGVSLEQITKALTTGELLSWIDNIPVGNLGTYDQDELENLKAKIGKLLIAGDVGYDAAIAAGDKIDQAMMPSIVEIPDFDDDMPDKIANFYIGLTQDDFDNLSPSDQVIIANEASFYDDMAPDKPFSEKIAEFVAGKGDPDATTGKKIDYALESAILMMTQSEYDALSDDEKVKLHDDGNQLADPTGALKAKLVQLNKTSVDKLASRGGSPKVTFDWDDNSGPHGMTPIYYEGQLIGHAESSPDGSAVQLYDINPVSPSSSYGQSVGVVNFDDGESIPNAVIDLVDSGMLSVTTPQLSFMDNLLSKSGDAQVDVINSVTDAEIDALSPTEYSAAAAQAAWLHQMGNLMKDEFDAFNAKGTKTAVPNVTKAPAPAAAPASATGSKFFVDVHGKIKKVNEISTPASPAPPPSMYKIKMPSQAATMQQTMLSAAGKTWNGVQVAAIKKYGTSVGYRSINAVLRDDPKQLKLFNDAQLADAVKHAVNLQNAMTPLTDDVKLFRGTGAHAFGQSSISANFDELKKLQGSVVTDKGFLSTTVDENKGVGYDYAKKPIQVVFSAPAGTPALYVDSAIPGHSEHEILLAAGTSYRIDEVRKATDADRAKYGNHNLEHVVEATIVQSPVGSSTPLSAPPAKPTAYAVPTTLTPVVPSHSPNLGKSKKITTTVIYKTKYVHGAVVAYHKNADGSLSRLAWSESNKKFISQNYDPFTDEWVAFAGYGKGEAYQLFGKGTQSTDWYAPPSGDSAIGSGGLFGTTSVAPKISTTAPAPSTVTTAPAPAPVKQEKFDVDELQKLHGQIPAGMWPGKERELFDDFKKNSSSGFVTLSSPETSLFAALHETLVKNNDLAKVSSLIKPLNMLQLLKIIDEESTNKANAIAKSKGEAGDLVNAQLYEKKLVAWLQTPSGATYATEILYPPPPAPYDPSGPINANKTYKSPNFTPQIIDTLHKIKDPATIGIPDPNANVFAPISHSKALELQKTQLANAPWTTTQKNALIKYTGHYYTEMNPVIRDVVNEVKYKSETTLLTAARTAVNIQAAMRPLPESVKVFRKTNPGQFSAFGLNNSSKFADIKKLEGKLFIDQAPMSTSINPNKWSGSVHFEIDLPKGTPAVYVDNISSHQGEMEMILALGLKYRIISVKEQYGITKVHMRVEA